jgi:MgtC family
MAVHRDCGNREDLHQEARIATSATASVRFITPRTSIALDQPAIGLWWEAAIPRIQDTISSILASWKVRQFHCQIPATCATFAAALKSGAAAAAVAYRTHLLICSERCRCEMSNTEMLIRLIGAAVLGSMIGLEREWLQWAAGIRTHMLVCVGSCLIMIVSQYGFSNILTYEHVVLDPSRIAAQVVSGIGFLGAGAILARGEIVKGLIA